MRFHIDLVTAPIRPLFRMCFGPVYTSMESSEALEERAYWPTVGRLPKYAPELNDTEPAWKPLKQTELVHQNFADFDELGCVIHQAVRNRNNEEANHAWVRLGIPS